MRGKRVRELEGNLVDAENKRVSLESDLQTSYSNVQSLEGEVSTLRPRAALVSGLEGEIATLKPKAERVSSLESEISSLQPKAALVPGLESELTSLRPTADRVPELESELEALRAKAGRADELEQEIAGLRGKADECAECQDALSKESERARDLESQLQALRSKADRADDLEREIEGLRSQAAAPAVVVPASAPVAEAAPASMASSYVAGDTSWSSGMTELGTLAANHEDDLKVVNGIGPVMEETLKGFGIQSWEQLAAFSADDIAKVTEAISSFPGRIERDQWVEQAQDLVVRFPLTTPYDRPTRDTFLNKKKT